MNKETPSTVQTYAYPGVMVVDDEECIRATMTELLALEGLQVVTASGAQECLEHLQQGFRGVILMDVMMPGMNGWDTIRAIEKSGCMPGNIIFMLTAMDSPDERMEGLQEVVVDYITKPFNPDHLVTTVQTYLGYLRQLADGA